MGKKSEVYENDASKRRVTIQIRPYDSTGKYETLEGDNATLQVKNASVEEVKKVIRGALSDNFGNNKDD